MSKISEIYGSNVFSKQVMQERLPKDIYKEILKTINDGKQLTLEVANVVANAMKDWAVEKGATHFTHWFQPMTGKTAEKHDSFLSFSSNGTALEEFSGKALIKGEPDASSFPNGGLRVTFEARGYTAWDCTSPAYVKESEGTVTLCIPTAFYSYNGEALDKKTPLLRSMEAVDKAAKRVLKFFGSEPLKVITTVGAEQEYFLIDKRLYQERKDLIYTGRTLFGASSPKGQELDDHYFGSIKENVAAFMRDIDKELWKLGVSVKTRHNEVAPAQHEIVPIFTTANIATDHNQLAMEMLEKVANRHNLVCLLNEKPFSGVNGSGKHNNWALATSDGVNLLDPGETPHENTQFLVFFSAVIKAVDKHAELLRISASGINNDHRLGANEAPPAIISIFVGEQLEDILTQIEKGELNGSIMADTLDTGVITLPVLKKDVTDRNRTSPFAFTGNKFEFRMPGSSQTIADPNIMLNTIVADVLDEFANELEGIEDLSSGIKHLITKTIREHRRVIFNGNGYSSEWVEEAEDRGLLNLKTTVDALPYLISEKTIAVFNRQNVLSSEELQSRYEVKLDDYIKKAFIEATTMVHIARKQIFPAAIKYMEKLSNSVVATREAVPGLKLETQIELISKISDYLDNANNALRELEEAVEITENIKGIYSVAKSCRDLIITAMERLRIPCDELELLVAKEYWPFPSYGDLLFRI